MFESNIFDEYLAEESKRVLDKLRKGEEPLSQDDKLIMILKSQTNHFHHLDVELRQDMKELREDMKELREDMKQENRELREDMKKGFEMVNARFEMVNARMDRFMFWSLGLTLSSTIFIIGFLKVLG